MIFSRRRPLSVAITGIFLGVISVLAIDLSTGKTVYEVPGAHLDTQWQWTLDQTTSQYLPNTLHTNFNYFAQYPEYKFNFEGAYRYWIIKQNGGAVPGAGYTANDWTTLKNYVSQGKWIPMGGTWNANDVNLPSAEALIRQTLYSQMFFMDEFGRKSDDIYLPDCFGFGYALPTIEAHCGLSGFTTQKFDLWGGWFPTPFPIGKWIGVDGRFVIACLKPGPYDNGMDIRSSDGDNEKGLSGLSGNPAVWAAYDYIGTGDQGGGPSSANVSAMINRIRANATNDIKVYCTSSDSIYKDLTPAQVAGLPSFDGELLMKTHGTGCYTSWAQMKLRNRRNEQRAALAEFSCVVANNLSGGSFTYPADTIKHGWWLTLAQQFHDVITGTSIAAVYANYAIPAEDSAFNYFNYALGLSVNSIANSVSGQFLSTSVSETGRVPLVLVNPLNMSRADIVEATVNFGTVAPAGVKVFDPDGNEVPAQIDSAIGQNVFIAFLAQVPSASYSVFEVKPMATPNAPDPNLSVIAAGSGSTISNEYYAVTVNANGDIASVVARKIPGTPNLFSAPSRFEFRPDIGTSFPAWELRYQDVTAAPTAYVDQQVAMSVFENGPARVSLKVTRTKNNSTFTQIVSLASGSAGSRVDIDNSIYWQTTGSLLKVSFPLSFANPKATWDLGIGTIQRGNVLAHLADTLYEVPGQQWADLSRTDAAYGMSILNNCKYGWSKPNDNTLNLSLIHSPSPSANYQCDQSSIPLVGVHRFKYSFYGHPGDWTNGTIAQAERLNQPMYAVQVPPRPGKSGKVFSFVRTDTSQVDVMAIKKAERSSNYVIRVRETMGKPIQNATLTFPANTIASAVEVSGVEDTVQGTQFAISGNALTFSMTKYQPRTFSVKLSPPVAVNQKFSDLTHPKNSMVTLTIAQASCKSLRAEIRLPYGVKINSLSITDVLGRIVQNLVEQRIITRASTIFWDGKDMNSRLVRTGVYFIRCDTDQGHWTNRLSVVQ